MLEKYINLVFDESVEQGHEQWNMLLTDQFPTWLNRTKIKYNSFFRHLDVYLCAPNNTNLTNDLIEEMKIRLNEVLLNDGNASIRLNHLRAIEPDAKLKELVTNLPTLKLNTMQTSKR